MANKKEILSKIKQLLTFSADEDETNEDLKFLDVEISEDLTIRVEGETLEIGSAVSKVTDGDAVLVEDGSLDGEHTVDDKVIVIKDNVIESIREEAPVEIELAVEAPTNEYQTQIESVIDRVTTYEEQFAELRTVVENFGKLFEDYLSDTPADEGTVVKKFKTTRTEGEIKSSLDAIRKIRKTK